MANTETKEKISGKIEALSNTGAKIDGKWYNLSKWYKGPKLAEGMAIEATIKDDWLQGAKEIQGHTETQAPAHIDNKQWIISRQAWMNTAVSILATLGGPVDPDDVIRLADYLGRYAMEGWIPEKKAPDKEDLGPGSIHYNPVDVKNNLEGAAHAFHDDQEANRRVKSFFAQARERGYDTEEKATEWLNALFPNKPIGCKHRFFKHWANWKDYNSLVFSDNVETLYGK